MAPADRTEQSVSFRAAVVAPTYNNGRTLRQVLSRLDSLDMPVIVVNDGSTDDTAQILAEWQADAARGASRHAQAHAVNRGKAAAMQTGFALAAQLGFTHCVTIDTDGQLDPGDIPQLLDAARSQPSALVVGVRDASADDYPAPSRLGRRLSNLMIRLESGLRIADSQCGLRVYPLSLVSAVPCRAGHFGFETEIITRAAWIGEAVIGVPVSCRYLPRGERVSHFKPWRDTARAIRMHGRLLLDAFWDWISPARAWRQVRRDRAGRTDFAAGFALGVFIGNLPLYGFHTLLALYSAQRFRMHPISVVAGSHISTPPIGPLLVTIAITVGHVLLHGALPSPADYDVFRRGIPSTLGPLLLEWAVGGVIVGLAAGACAFVAASLVFRTAFASGEAE
jgi:glycosyltransferase involved in cell wall biosynthesis